MQPLAFLLEESMGSVVIVDITALIFLKLLYVFGKDLYKSKLNYCMSVFLLLSTHIIISSRMIDTYKTVESKFIMLLISLFIGVLYFIAGGFIINIKKVKTIVICEAIQIVMLILLTYIRL